MSQHGVNSGHVPLRKELLPGNVSQGLSGECRTATQYNLSLQFCMQAKALVLIFQQAWVLQGEQLPAG